MDLSKLVPELEFYGTGDEAYELFQAACGFCYQLTSLGDNERAAIVYGWAKEMADGSKQWYMENREEELEIHPGCSHKFNREKLKFCSKCGKKAWLEPNVDMAKGYWGYM